MRSLPPVLIAVAVLCTAANGLDAQSIPQLKSGSRVRLVSPGLPADQQVVRVESVANDTVIFRSEQYPATRALSLREVSAVDLSLGERRRTARGASVGLAAGAIIGAVVGYATYTPCEGFCLLEPTSPGGGAAWGAVGGGLLGLVTGTTIGFFTKSERWQRIHTNTNVSVVPARRGGAIGFSHSF